MAKLYRLMGSELSMMYQERDLGVLVDSLMKGSTQCVVAVKKALPQPEGPSLSSLLGVALLPLARQGRLSYRPAFPDTCSQMPLIIGVEEELRGDAWKWQVNTDQA